MRRARKVPADPALPRPPRWETSSSSKAPPTMSAQRLQAFKERQLETLQFMQLCESEGSWEKLRLRHFDWWMFPIDDGSKPEFNVSSEADVHALKSDSEWLTRYRESVRLVAAAWGWNVAISSPLTSLAQGMVYDGKDVRLAKVCRSLFLFEEPSLLASMQCFAREVQRCKEGASFSYHGTCLDELLFFQLPRRAVEAPHASPTMHQQAWGNPSALTFGANAQPAWMSRASPHYAHVVARSPASMTHTPFQSTASLQCGSAYMPTSGPMPAVRFAMVR